MGNESILSRLPVLRLLLPMVAGIVLFRFCSNLLLPFVLLALMVMCLLVAMRLKSRDAARRLMMRRYRLMPLWLAMIAVGWLASWLVEPVRLDLNSVRGKTACARIETIKYNEQSMLMQVKLLNADGSDAWVRASHIQLSTRGCDYSLVAGNLIAFVLKLEEVQNMGNPDEMDYAQHLHDKGIIYRQHIDVGSVAKVGDSPTLLTRAFSLRQDLQHRVLNSQLGPESQGLIIAMLLGNDDFIEPWVRDSFAQSGIAHVLALSGLHVAVITLIIWFLLFPLDYAGGKKPRLVLTLLILIAYDVLTGMSPSVIRSTVMIAFVFCSFLFYRKSTPLNSVAAAALAILVFAPNSLFSVGFQLSFITVTLLIVFYQVFDLKFPSNRFLKYLCTTLVTSAVAMLSTMVLTAYYFNTTSMVAVFTNVLILPLVPVIMVLGAVALILLAMGGGLGQLAAIIDGISDATQSIAGAMSSLSLAGNNVYVTWMAVVMYYAILIMLGMWVYRRNARWLLAAGATLVVGLACSLVQDFMTPRRGLVVFNAFNSTPIFYFNGNQAMLWVPDVENDYDIDNFKRWNRAFLAHYHIDSIMMVDSLKCELPGAVVDPPYANFMGTGILTAGKGKWKNYTREDTVALRFDVALVTKGFHSQISRLKELIDCDTIVLSGGMYDEDNVTLDNECKSSGIPFYNIKKSGAYQKYY